MAGATKQLQRRNFTTLWFHPGVATCSSEFGFTDFVICYIPLAVLEIDLPAICLLIEVRVGLE